MLQVYVYILKLRLNNTTTIEQSRSEYLLEWRELIQILKRAEIQRKMVH